MWRKTRSQTGGRNLFGNVITWHFYNYIIISTKYYADCFRRVTVLISIVTLVTTGEDMAPAMIPVKKHSEEPLPSLSQSLGPSGTFSWAAQMTFSCTSPSTVTASTSCTPGATTSSTPRTGRTWRGSGTLLTAPWDASITVWVTRSAQQPRCSTRQVGAVTTGPREEQTSSTATR